MIDTLPPKTETRASPPPSTPELHRIGAPIGFLAACLILAIGSVILALKVHRQSGELIDTRAQLSQANSKAALAQADLDAAKVQGTALQAQLASGQTQQTDLQSQIAAAKQQVTGLQAQISKDQRQAAELKSQVDSSKAAAAGAQAQLAADLKQRTDLQAQLDQANAQLGDQQAKLAKAQADLTRVHPLVVEAQRLPLTASFEKSFWDHGFTLHVTNPGAQPMNVKITLSGPQKNRYQATVVEAGATVDVPSLPAGEKVVIASEGYDPLNLTAQ